MPAKQKRVTIDSILGQPEPTRVTLKLLPAYGRNYKDSIACMRDWKNEAKDFKVVGGPYCSIRDTLQLTMMADDLEFYSLEGKLLMTVRLS